MNELRDVILFIDEFKKSFPEADKAAVQASFVDRFMPERRRSLFIGRGYSIRFSAASTGSFSNTVLSLGALQTVDRLPLVICIVRLRRVEFVLANSTFLRKISHSSQTLRIDNVRGSFNGSDIVSEYGGLANQPRNFVELFAMHTVFSWEENLERLVEATTAIVGRNTRFSPTKAQRETILLAPDRASSAVASAEFAGIERDLRQQIQRSQAEILQAAESENVNLRGNAIEQIVTGGRSSHDLGDLVLDLTPDARLAVDVKTKLIDRASAPKAYNIDKMLAFHAEPGSVFAFLMLGIDTRAETVTAGLIPVLDSTLLDATIVQHHWAGRGSRGVTQLSGRLESFFNTGFVTRVDIKKAREFLAGLLDS
jgi:hypothetical protein